MTAGPLAPPTPRRLIVYRAALALAAAYFVAGGVLALWFPADGLDLYVSYVGGTCSANHESPYDRVAYLKAWDSLETPPAIAESRYFGFAYPPSWIPLCMVLSLMPWGAALWSWKLLNVALLVGIVLTTFRLQRDDGLDTCDRYAVWCVALTLSPTITVMTVGQSSLFVLFMLLWAGWSLHQGRRMLAGLAVALALIKPQLASAVVLFLLLRTELGTLATAAACTAILSGLGLALSDSGVGTYLAALRFYTTINAPDSHIAVGIASLLAHFTHLGVVSVTAIGAAVGVALVAGLALLRRRDGARLTMPDVLPVLLYVAPFCFRCHGYDLVSLVPLFAWSRAQGTSRPLRYAIQALCLTLILPRAALRIGYEKLLSGVVSQQVYQAAEFSFRSWILVLLLAPVLLALRQRVGSPAVHLAR